MRALSAAELLAAWEQGLSQTPLERALTLLRAATGEEPDALARLSIGQRDARLLTLRELTFGPQLVSVTTCPNCGERLEMTFGVAELRAAPEAEQTDPCALSCSGYDVLFRLPNTLDLAALTSGADVADARRVLLGRCLLSARRGDAEVAAGHLPPEVLEAVAGRMGEADPQADIQLALVCTRCAHRWQEAFDVGLFLWGELHAWAARTLGEVHKLARAYGWREADILALSPVRRQFYLDMIGG
jgi:hypothetical protein